MSAPRRSRIVALSLLMICGSLAGCASSPPGSVPLSVAVKLPNAPNFLKPVTEPTFQAGVDDGVKAFRKTRSALRYANGRLSATASWYRGLKTRYSGK